MKELEQMECLEVEQLDDHSREQLQQIELLEQEEETDQKQHYTEMQTQLERLEEEEDLEQSKQIFYYEWMQEFQSIKEKVNILGVELIENFTFT